MYYLLLLGICLAIAFYLKYKYKFRLFSSWKKGLLFYLILLIIMIPMDIFAVSKGLWYFPGNGILNLYLFTLPIEEYLFVLVVSYFILMVYRVVSESSFHKAFREIIKKIF